MLSCLGMRAMKKAMTQMKKLTVGCFLALLLVGLLAGCGGGGNTGVPVDEMTMTLQPQPTAGEIDTATYVISRGLADTFISKFAPGVNYGGGTDMAVSGTKYGMIRFGLSTVPTNATVHGAVLKLYVAQNYSNPGTYTVHRVNKPWAEMGATWNTHSTAYQVNPEASTIIQPAMLGSYVSFNVTNLVRNWLASPGDNNGFLIRQIGTSNLPAVHLATRESGGHCPRLQIHYGSGPAPVLLGTAGQYVILSKTGISTTGTTTIVGNIGVSPAAHTYLTGFGTLSAANVFDTSPLVAGNIYAANMKPPTPANLTTAIGNMQTAYTDAAGRSIPDFTELYGGNISGKTLLPGLYKWGTGVLINQNVTLKGTSADVWIFQIAGNLKMASAKHVFLSGGAQAKNIFWQVAGYTDLGTTADFSGIVLCKTKIVLKTGAVMHGRALSQTAVTLDANAVTQPAL